MRLEAAVSSFSVTLKPVDCPAAQDQVRNDG